MALHLTEKAREEKFQAEDDLRAMRQVLELKKSPKRKAAVRKMIASEKKALAGLSLKG